MSEAGIVRTHVLKRQVNIRDLDSKTDAAEIRTPIETSYEWKIGGLKLNLLKVNLAFVVIDDHVTVKLDGEKSQTTVI